MCDGDVRLVMCDVCVCVDVCIYVRIHFIVG